jgi:hypothetical protein
MEFGTIARERNVARRRLGDWVTGPLGDWALALHVFSILGIFCGRARLHRRSELESRSKKFTDQTRKISGMNRLREPVQSWPG